MIACVFRDDPDMLAIYEGLVDNNNGGETDKDGFDFITVV